MMELKPPEKKKVREYTACLWRYYEQMYRSIHEIGVCFSVEISPDEERKALSPLHIREWYDEEGAGVLSRCKEEILFSMERYKECNGNNK